MSIAYGTAGWVDLAVVLTVVPDDIGTVVLAVVPDVVGAEVHPANGVVTIIAANTNRTQRNAIAFPGFFI